MIKNLSPGSKYSEISLLCHADMLRACSFAPPELDIALRSLASEVADDVKGRLWKAQGLRPFFESVEPIDVTLYADAIVGLSHFLPEEEFTELIDACLEPERSDAVKMVAVKTFISIDQLVCVLFSELLLPVLIALHRPSSILGIKPFYPNRACIASVAFSGSVKFMIVCYRIFRLINVAESYYTKERVRCNGNHETFRSKADRQTIHIRGDIRERSSTPCYPCCVQTRYQVFNDRAGGRYRGFSDKNE